MTGRTEARRALAQHLLDAGLTLIAPRDRVDRELPELRWDGDTLIHDAAQPNDADPDGAPETVRSEKGAHELTRGCDWYVVDRHLADVLHAVT